VFSVPLLRTPLEQQAIEVRCTGQADVAAIATAQAGFTARTGWKLILTGISPPAKSEGTTTTAPVAAHTGIPDRFEPSPGSPRTELNWALTTARSWFGPETGCYKASADQREGVVALRFHFPDVARQQHAAHLAELATYIGWAVQVWPHPHQDILTRTARTSLPKAMSVIGTPTIQPLTHEVVMRVRGSATPEDVTTAAARFAERTGWKLVVQSTDRLG